MASGCLITQWGFPFMQGVRSKEVLSHSYLWSKEVKESSPHVQFLHMYACAHTPATTQ